MARLLIFAWPTSALNRCDAGSLRPCLESLASRSGAVRPGCAPSNRRSPPLPPSFDGREPCPPLLPWEDLDQIDGWTLEHVLAFVEECAECSIDRDARSDGGFPPETDHIFKMLGRSAPELAYVHGLRRRSLWSKDPPSALLRNVFGSLQGSVLHLTAIHDFDAKLYRANGMEVLETEGGGCGQVPRSMAPFAALRAHWPKVPCLQSVLEQVLKASGRPPTFLDLDLRETDFTQLLNLLVGHGYEHFKVSRRSHFDCTDKACAGGPLGDQATDWRMGLLWRNASSVAADALAIRVLDRRASEQLALHAALPGPQRGLGLCLTGQLRNRFGTADLEQVLRRFESFDVFAVVPTQDCALACERLAPLRAEVLCVDSLFMSPEELQWIREGPKADPDICPGHHCVYVWRDVDTCGRLLRRYMGRYRASYWRVARMRLDLRIEIFPKDVTVFDDDNTIWAYAIPHRQWIAMPDRFAIGPPGLMLDVYFTTYRWMLDRRSWRHYDPHLHPACARRGHFQVERLEGDQTRPGDTQIRAVGKLWPCPEHSARGLAYPGPENVLEARMLTFQTSAAASPGVTVRLRSDICFDHFSQIPEPFCEQLPKRHPHGFWTNDWSNSTVKGNHFQDYLRRQAAASGSAKTETRLLQYDAIFAAGLADFFLAEWGVKESRGQSRPPKILILGAGRGALAEQLGRWGLPVVAVDGSCIVEFTSGHSGLCADIVHPRGMSMWAEAECLGAEVSTAPRVDPEFKAISSQEAKIWCSWLEGMSVSDWTLAFNLVRDIPRHLLSRLVTQLSFGKDGIVLTRQIGRPMQDAKWRDLLRALWQRGYKVDRKASRRLGAFGGLLCCPWNTNAMVLRKRREARAGCSARLVEQLKGSPPCVLQQNYGCVTGGVWVHFGCRGYFRNGLSNPPTLCWSPVSEYTECPWKGVASTERPRRMPVKAAYARPTAFVARGLLRSDIAPADTVLANASRSHWYTQLFGLPLSRLYEAMDPLTSRDGGVWPDSARERLLLVATLRALKLAVLGGFAGSSLARVRPRMGRTYRALLDILGMVEVAGLSGRAEWLRLSLILDCLRVSADVGRTSIDQLLQRPGSVEKQGAVPKIILILEKLVNIVKQGHWQKSVWFEELESNESSAGRTWHLRVDSDDPFGRYVYRFAYQAAL